MPPSGDLSLNSIRGEIGPDAFTPHLLLQCQPANTNGNVITALRPAVLFHAEAIDEP